MHTFMVIIGGFILLALFLIGGRLVGNLPKGALLFIPVWLLLALANLLVGVTRAGYSFNQEIPVFLFSFALPAAFAGLLWWKYNSADNR